MFFIFLITHKKKITIADQRKPDRLSSWQGGSRHSNVSGVLGDPRSFHEFVLVEANEMRLPTNAQVGEELVAVREQLEKKNQVDESRLNYFYHQNSVFKNK